MVKYHIKTYIIAMDLEIVLRIDKVLDPNECSVIRDLGKKHLQSNQNS